MPTVAELRATVQPPGLLDRDSGEHWAGRLYMRRLSPHVTRAFLHTPITPNGVTGLMIACGLAAGALLGVPGLVPAVGAVLLLAGLGFILSGLPTLWIRGWNAAFEEGSVLRTNEILRDALLILADLIVVGVLGFGAYRALQTQRQPGLRAGRC